MTVAKQGASTTVPRLRFPEFRKAAPWQACSLIELADQRVKWSFIGGPFGSNLKASDYTPQGVRIIQLQNIGDGEFISDYKIHTSASKADELLSCNIYPGEIILSKMGDPVGRACVVPASEDRYVMCSDGIRLVVDQRVFARDFVFFAINFDGFRRRVESAATGSTRKRIALDTLKQLPLEMPQLAEQIKIADCLTSLDEVIAAQGCKVKALKAHKRGLMQQLFPRIGETRPRLRFPEFRNAPGWMDITIGDIGDVITGSTPSTARHDFYGGDRLFVSPADISDNRFVESTKTTLSDSGFAQARSVKASSVLFVCIGSTIGKVAQNMHECATNQQINAIEPKAGFNADFVFYSLELVSRDIAELAGRQAVPIINKSQFSAVRLRVTSPDEQQRIADCLSSLDTRISAESRQLAALKTHKKGLMQQLFPAPEAD